MTFGISLERGFNMSGFNLTADVVVTIGLGTIIIALLRLIWKNRKHIQCYANKVRDKKVNKLIKQAIKLIENDFKILIIRELRGATYQQGLSIIQELNERIDRHIKDLEDREVDD